MNKTQEGGGKYSAVEVMGKLIGHAKGLLLESRPDLVDYPQFGGTKKPASDLGLVFTIPPSWSIEQQTSMREAIRLAGFHSIDGFASEPVAAARRMGHIGRVKLQTGDVIDVFDVGEGTLDFTRLRFNGHSYDQVCSSLCSDVYLGGADFTAAIAADIAKTFGVAWNRNVFDKGGINLANVKNRADVWACIRAAKEVKEKLGNRKSASVAVELTSGRQLYKLTQSQANKFWKPLLARFSKCVKAAQSDTDGKPADYVMLVGGSSRLTCLQKKLAQILNRDDIVVCADSSGIVAGGAAEQACFADETSQALESGLGFVVRSRKSNRLENLLIVEPGTVLDPGGYYVEASGFFADTGKGNSELNLEPFVCRSGVSPKVRSDRSTVLSDAEIVYLSPVDVDLTSFPKGEHKLSVGIKIDPHRNLCLLVRGEGLDVEPISVKLAMSEAKSRPQRRNSIAVLFLLDISASMLGERGAKNSNLKRAAKQFVEKHVPLGARIGIIPFGPPPTLACPITDDIKQLIETIRNLSPKGGTPMGEAIQVANSLAKSQESDLVMVLFSDGAPNNIDLALTEGTKWKQRFRLITVGIGEDCIHPLLTTLATKPEDYSFGQCAAAIDGLFSRVGELIWSGQSSIRAFESRTDEKTDDAGGGAASGGGDNNSTQEAEESDESKAENWDDFESLDDEEAA